MQKKQLKQHMNEQANEQEQVIAEQEVADFSKADFSFMPNAKHIWRQQGYYLICREGCELEHAVFIGSEKIMTGETEDGQPILTARQ